MIRRRDRHGWVVFTPAGRWWVLDEQGVVAWERRSDAMNAIEYAEGLTWRSLRKLGWRIRRVRMVLQ